MKSFKSILLAGLILSASVPALAQQRNSQAPAGGCVTIGTTSVCPGGTAATVTGLTLSGGTLSGTTTATSAITSTETNSSTTPFNTGGRFSARQLDATANNWARAIQALDASNNNVGGLLWQIKNHTTGESEAVILTHGTSGIARERLRITDTFSGIGANFFTNAPQATLHIGATAAGCRSYNSFTDASNGEWAYCGSWAVTANVATFGTAKNGSGTARAMQLVTDGTAALTISTAQALTLNAAAYANCTSLSTISGVLTCVP